MLRSPRPLVLLLVAFGSSGAQAQEGGDGSRISLRPVVAAGDRYEVVETTSAKDRMTRLVVRQGTEVLLTQEDASGPLGLERELAVRRVFEDRVEEAGEAPAPNLARRLLRTWRKLDAHLKVGERGSGRGLRERRWSADVVGRSAQIARDAEGKITASLRAGGPQPQPGQEAPPEPLPRDLALCRADARLERCLPTEEKGRGESWTLERDALEALLASVDGYPFPRAAGAPTGGATDPRSADPLSAFLAGGVLEGRATLESWDEGVANVALQLSLRLPGIDPYAPRPKEGEGGGEGEGEGEGEGGEDAAVGSGGEEGSAGAASAEKPATLWDGELELQGRLLFDRTTRRVQSAVLSGEFRLRVRGTAAEGPARVEVETEFEGELRREVQIHEVRS